MIAIAFTGLARSGKDTAADYLVEKHGFKKLVLSEVLAEELKAGGKEDTKMNRSLLGEELRKQHGNDVLAKKVFEKAKESKWKRVVFSGIYSVAEVDFLRKHCETFLLVAVKADSKKRFGRRTGLDAQSENGFFARDKHNTAKFDLGEVIAAADHTIENNSTINALHKAIDELFQKI